MLWPRCIDKSTSQLFLQHVLPVGLNATWTLLVLELTCYLSSRLEVMSVYMPYRMAALIRGFCEQQHSGGTGEHHTIIWMICASDNLGAQFAWAVFIMQLRCLTSKAAFGCAYVGLTVYDCAAADCLQYFP